jgi:hypothetical protein
MSSVMTARTGAFAYAKYGWESTFKGGATTRDKVFGRGQRVSSITRNENPEKVYELGDRPAKLIVYKGFEGSASFDFFVSNPWIFRAVMGNVSTTGTGPYTHTYTVAKLPPSMEIEVGFQGSGGNVVRLLRGAVASTFSLTASVNEIVRGRMDVLYADEVITTTLGSAIVDVFEPFTFAHGTLEVPVGNVIAEVQSFDMTIANNALLVWGLGDIKASSAVWQAFDPTGRISVTMKDASFLNRLRTTDTNGRLVLNFNPNHQIIFNFDGVGYGEHTVGYEPNALVVEEVPILLRSLTSIQAINNVATHP